MYMYFVLVVPFKGSSIWHQQKAKSHVHVTEMLMAHVEEDRIVPCPENVVVTHTDNHQKETEGFL